MFELKNIVVGVDYSAQAKSALSQAKRLAAKSGATVHAIHVVESLAMADMGEAINKTLEQISEHFVGVAKGYLEKAAQEAGFRDGELRVHVEVGAPLPAINRLIEQVRAELLIVGRTGSTSATRGIGGLAFKCVRASPTRVLVLHGEEKGEFKRIVAATDFSEHSRAAMGEAVSMAKLEGAELHVVHVRRPELVVPVGDPLMVPPVWLGDQKELDAAADRMARRKVEAELAPFGRELEDMQVLRVVASHVSSGLGLMDYAHGVKADLIVLGTLGRTGLRKLLLGSTAERVVREGGCAVLAIKPSGE